MKIIRLSAIPMSAPVPAEQRHRTDLGTKVKSDATLIRVETDNGLTGIGAALGTPPIVAAIVEHELAPECVGEDPMFSERIYEKMYNGSRRGPALERGVTQADESRRRGVIMEAIAGVDIAVWDVKAQALVPHAESGDSIAGGGESGLPQSGRQLRLSRLGCRERGSQVGPGVSWRIACSSPDSLRPRWRVCLLNLL